MRARACVMVIGLVAGCGGGRGGGGGPTAVTATPANTAVPDDVLTVGAPTCTATYSPQSSTPASATWVAAAGAVITATMNHDASRIDARAAATLTMRSSPADPTSERLASLRAALGTIPAGCHLVWFDEARLDVQPAFADASPAEAARIAAAEDVIADAVQLVGTCHGCPVIALALSGDPDRARAVGWSPLTD